MTEDAEPSSTGPGESTRQSGDPGQAGTTYDVVLLIEQGLTATDVTQVRSLHEEIEDPVAYHVLVPEEDAAGRVEYAVGALGAPDTMAMPLGVVSPDDVAELQRRLDAECKGALKTTLDAFLAAGATAEGRVVAGDPVEALAETCGSVGAAEAIVLTRPHVVAEFFHLDWSSRARRKLGVPVLHLLEHESFDEQAENFGEEGVTGL